MAEFSFLDELLSLRNQCILTCHNFKFFTQGFFFFFFFEIQETTFCSVHIFFTRPTQTMFSFKSPSYLQPRRSRPCSRLWLTGSIRYFPGVSRIQRLTCLHGGLAEPALTGPSGTDLARSEHKVCGGLLYWDRLCQWNREDPVHAARSGFLTCRSCYSPAKV